MSFMRDYELIIGIGARAVRVVPPMRISFEATKDIEGEVSKCTVKVWNLIAKSRDVLIKAHDDEKYIPFALLVGYRGKKDLIFKGSVREGKWYRDGGDFVSEVVAEDGGHDVRFSYTAAVANDKAEAVKLALGDMSNTELGEVAGLAQTQRPVVLVGNSHDQIKKLAAGMDLFIEDERLFITKQDEPRKGYAPLVSSKTGLLSVEQREDKIEFQTILNPTLKLGGMCKLESVTNKKLTGGYKITAMTYVGDSHGNDWTQKVEAKRL